VFNDLSCSIIDLQLQDLGQPPKELAGDAVSPFNFMPYNPASS
jgi:hypothetical protein